MLWILFICFLFSQACAEQVVSSRQEMFSYLQNEGCKSSLLNHVLVKIVTKDKYYKLSYDSLYRMVNSHMGQFEHKDIYKCYEILVSKFIDERKNYLRFG